MRVATACLALLLAITVLSVQAQDNKAAKVSHLRAARETDADPEAKKKGADGKKKNWGKPKKARARKEGRKASAEGRMQGRGIVVNGNDCEYITLKDITGNSGCSSGQKFVLKGSSGVRRQFLIVSDNVILAFVVKKKKFTECTAFTDITTSVTCKSIDGLDSVDLSVTAASNSSATNAAATTAAGAAATTAAGAAATTAAGAAATTAAGAAATTAAAAATTAAGAAATTAAGGAATTAAPTGTNSTSGRQTFPLTTSPASSHSKFTKVFGVAVFGHSSISDAKFQHVASVLAEWLDNDEDGCVDIPTVLAKLLAAKAATIAEKSDPGVTDAIITAGYEPASVTYNSELLPACAGTAATSACADATLEEVLHMVTAQGYAAAFPATFGESNEQASTPSLLTAAMDVARGGKFTSIPSSYPSAAWYTYNDATCKYNCMATEYVYWGISAMVGSIAGRASTIADEWKLATKATFLAGDTKLAAILQDTSTYRTPTVSPNGQYAAPTTCSTGASSGGTLA